MESSEKYVCISNEILSFVIVHYYLTYLRNEVVDSKLVWDCESSLNEVPVTWASTAAFVVVLRAYCSFRKH